MLVVIRHTAAGLRLSAVRVSFEGVGKRNEFGAPIPQDAINARLLVDAMSP
jgi:hypothetical protein